MAVFTPVLDTYGWETDQAVVVQTPTFDVDVTTDFGTFDWFSNDDATLLTNAVIERGIAAGWDAVESNVTSPSEDSDEASLAVTFAKLQKLFTDLNFGDCIDEDYNNTTANTGQNTTGFLTWSTIATDFLDDDEYFEQFCIKAGLTDGGSNYGFRYIDDTGSVIYPNSNRTVQAGDVISTGTETDIYLEDLLNALDRIEFVGWEMPDDDDRHGRKFSWNSLSGSVGDGDSEDDWDFYSWLGDPALEFGQAKTDFSEGIGGGDVPAGFASSKGELAINSSTSEYTATILSDMTASDINFDADISGTWDVQIKTHLPTGTDSFSPLGSGLALGWNTPSSGINGADESVVTDEIGVETMDTDLFVETGVPVFGLAVVLDPVSSSGTALYDWAVSATVNVTGGTPASEFIFGNINGEGTWSGDLSEGSGGGDSGEALNLGKGEYSGGFDYVIFKDSPNEDTDGGGAGATVTEGTGASASATPPPPPSSSVI